MILRDYPPGVIYHAPHCPDVQSGGTGRAPSLTAPQAVAAYPSFQLCNVCTTNATGLEDLPYVVVEQIPYGPHLYIPLPGQPPSDASRPLCQKCRGTHGSATGGRVVS